MVVISLAPEAPSGWPSAMAPPLTLVRSRSAPVSSCQASTTGANASLISNRSMSSRVRPAFLRTRWVAGIGALSIITGSAPARAMACTRARGRRSKRRTADSDASSNAAAPSEIWLEVAAVMRPPGRSTCSAAIFSLDTTGDHQVVGAGEHALRGEVERLLRGAALAVDGGARHLLGQAGRQPRGARDVEALRPDLVDTAEDHVLDRSRVRTGALHQHLEHVRRQIGGMHAGESAAPTPDRRAHRLDDVCLGHQSAPCPPRPLGVTNGTPPWRAWQHLTDNSVPGLR